MSRFYVTTPIYYVNARPHLGHVYTTTVADVVARYQRLRGDDVFFLTGTDEHAAKVVDAAAEHGLGPQEWADRNAEAFREAFARFGSSHDDFIRTTESRHVERVRRYVEQLIGSGDVYLGEYEGWYDAGQEEYVPETKAKELDYKSPINGRPLVRKKEKNYFFRLSRYGEELTRLLEDGHFAVRPEARRNEVLGRLRQGLNDVPISRTGAGGWGIRVPGDDEHTIYVWIDALFNYLSTVDTEERRPYWPPDVQLIAKDILWFHAVIWPAMLLALSRLDGNSWIRLPKALYTHSFWISEGQKMSKSLGNFVDLERLDHFAERFSLDALRYFLITNGPLGTQDGDFVVAKFVDVYNSDLANTLGNCFSRVANMCHRYFDGKLPAPGPRPDVPGLEGYGHVAEDCATRCREAFDRLDLVGGTNAGLELVRAIDGYIDRTQPFKLAKDPERLPEVGTVLYNCAEALRIAAVLLWPVLPGKSADVCRRLGWTPAEKLAAGFTGEERGELEAWSRWGGLEPGVAIERGDALFQRVDKDKYLDEFAAKWPVIQNKEEVVEEKAPTPEGKPPQVPDAAAKAEEKGAEGGLVSIEQFFETQLRVAEVRAAEAVPKSKKLIKLNLDVGGEPRTVVAGIAEQYAPEDLVGRQVVVVANLKPAKLMGIESQGMVLAASVDGKPILVQPSAPVPSGTQVR